MGDLDYADDHMISNAQWAFITSSTTGLLKCVKTGEREESLFSDEDFHHQQSG